MGLWETTDLHSGIRVLIVFILHLTLIRLESLMRSEKLFFELCPVSKHTMTGNQSLFCHTTNMRDIRPSMLAVEKHD